MPRNVVVSGAAGAIGAAVCRRYLDSGPAHVVMLDGRLDALSDEQVGSLVGQTVSRKESVGLRVLTAHGGDSQLHIVEGVGDLSHRPTLEKQLMPVLQELDGGIEALICIAGGNPPEFGKADFLSQAGTLPTELMMRHFEFNTVSSANCIALCLDALLSARGSVVFTSSVNAVSGIGELPYSCAKAALHPLAMNLAVEYGPLGLNANAVALGTVKSPHIWDERLAEEPELLDKIASRVPRRAVGTPDEAAAVLCWLVSRDAVLVNGQVITADGGWIASAGTSLGVRPGQAKRKWYD